MWIEDDVYRKIVEKMPIPTVDAVIVHKGKFLLLKRNNPPVKGEWWLPGGRIRRNESFEDAVRREVLEETGLTCKTIKPVGVISQVFPECHTVSVYFLVESDNVDVKMNSEHSEYKWFTELPKNAHLYITTMIEKASLSAVKSRQ
jgi:colanic acid biosynthesis protein WcaH